MPATRIWLKNPLAIFTANGLDARGGLVLQDGVITEVLARKEVRHVALVAANFCALTIFDTCRETVANLYM